MGFGKPKWLADFFAVTTANCFDEIEDNAADASIRSISNITLAGFYTSDQPSMNIVKGGRSIARGQGCCAGCRPYKSRLLGQLYVDDGCAQSSCEGGSQT